MHFFRILATQALGAAAAVIPIHGPANTTASVANPTMNFTQGPDGESHLAKRMSVTLYTNTRLEIQDNYFTIKECAQLSPADKKSTDENIEYILRIPEAPLVQQGCNEIACTRQSSIRLCGTRPESFYLKDWEEVAGAAAYVREVCYHPRGYEGPGVTVDGQAHAPAEEGAWYVQVERSFYDC